MAATAEHCAALERMRSFLRVASLCFPFSVAVADDLFTQLTGLPSETTTSHESPADYVTAQKSLPEFRIVPEDVIQDSVQLVRLSTKSFALRWRYTEAGARRRLAFLEAHTSEKVRTLFGTFETPPLEYSFRPIPPYFKTYAEWKEGWLKWRTDKFYSLSEEDAHRIVEGLKGK